MYPFEPRILVAVPSPSFVSRMFSGSRHFSLNEMSDGIYAAIANDGGWAVCNAGIIDLGDRTLVFDTFVNAVAATDLKVAAEGVTGRTVEDVVNSHCHRDHVRGNQVFTDAQIVATRKIREELIRRWKVRTEIVRKEGLDSLRREFEEEFRSWKSDPTTTELDKVLWDGYLQGILQGLDTTNPTLPDVTFETGIAIHGSKRSAEVITFGGGHCMSDAILYLPEERTAFLGDLMFVDYQTPFFNGDPDELFRILGKVEALGAKSLVPGHGPVGTLADIGRMHDYYDELQRTVEEVRASSGGVQEAVEKPMPARFDALKWHSFRKANIEFLFERKSKKG